MATGDYWLPYMIAHFQMIDGGILWIKPRKSSATHEYKLSILLAREIFNIKYVFTFVLWTVG